MGVYSETFSDIYSHAVSETKWWSIKAYADIVSYGDFDPKELRNENLTICIQTSEHSLKSIPALGHLIIGSLLSVVYQANGNIKGRVLYMLDEVNFFGRLKALADSRDGGRKYKITIHIFIIIKILKSFPFNKSTFKITNYICCYDWFNELSKSF